MNYFELYERIKEQKTKVPIGSIWVDHLGEVEIMSIHSYGVRFKDLTNECYGRSTFNNFLKNFERTIE